jgi:hypothetical protein
LGRNGLDRTNLALLRGLRERELRDAAREWSPFEEGGLGTYDYLQKIKTIDQVFLFLTQVLRYFEPDLMDEPPSPRPGPGAPSPPIVPPPHPAT